MNRECAITTIRTIGAKLAEKYGYTEMQVGEDRQKGMWGEKFTEFLETLAGGDCSSEITWTRPGNDRDYVKFRFRFDNPVVCIRFRDGEGEEVLANVEFTCHRYLEDGIWEEDDRIGDYVLHKKGSRKLKKVEVPCRIAEEMLWNPRVARPYLDEIEALWEEMDK